MAKVLDRLVHYTVVHFAHEERLMRLYDYPEQAAHKAKHEALSQQVLSFRRTSPAGVPR